MKLDVILTYLTALEQNNNRDWFHAHKSEYHEASGAFEELVGSLMMELHARDAAIPLLDPKSLTFKLNRDTRFSHDKSPYNPAFRAHIAPRGKLPIPVGYYILVKPGDRSFLGGGMFADMFQDATAMVRDQIAAHGVQWQEIITDPSFTESFRVGGTALKRVPRGYDPAHPQAEFLKYKSWYLEYPLADQELLAPDFIPAAVEIFSKMQPFNAFLNEALAGFQMPAR